MERGTDWEREAVERRWAALEREQELGMQLLTGVMYVLFGLVALTLARISEVCMAGDGFTGLECTAVVPSLLAAGLTAGGLIVLTLGCRHCWRALRA